MAEVQSPYTDRLTKNTVFVITTESLEGSQSYSYTSKTIVNVALQIPYWASKIRVAFTSYGTDEMASLVTGLGFEPKTTGDAVSGCGVYNPTSDVHWNGTSGDKIIAVTPSKTYNLILWVDGYKSRNLGFTFYYGPSVNELDTDETDL